MQGKFGKLKYLANELEHSFNLADKNKLNIHIKKMREIIDEIELESTNKQNFRKKAIFDKIQSSFDRQRDSDKIDSAISVGINNIDIEEIKNSDKEKNYIYKKINTIPFLIKPIKNHGVSDIYNGNFLERFCEIRTQDLMNALCINQHNAFWHQHQTIKGNVYGAVPKELLSENSINILKKLKWEMVDVDIFDFGKNKEDEDVIIKTCEDKFNDYILVVESSTDAYLALVF